jgi:gluconolactonase
LEPVLPLDSAEVFFDGIFSEPRLRHPQGIAIDESGDIWCGGETGEIYRISADGSGIETVASTGGFILGLAFDDDQNLYACDMRHSAVFRLDTRTGRLAHFANGGGGDEMRIPNFPVIDGSRNCLYVSDNYDPEEKGPGVWRFDLENGEGGLWYNRAMTFANGMALSRQGSPVRRGIETRKKANCSWTSSSVCLTAWHSTPQATCTSPATNPRAYTG